MKKVTTTSKKELDKIIAEEYQKAKKLMALKNKRDSIMEEISMLKKEAGIDEVSVSGHKDKGSEYYMKGLPVAKFEKKGTHLKEDDSEMETMETGEMTSSEMGEFEKSLSDIGKKLDMLFSMESEEHGEDLTSGGEDEEFEIEDDSEGTEDMVSDETSTVETGEEADVESGEESEDEESIDENDIIDSETKEESSCDENEKEEEQEGSMMNEGVVKKMINENANLKSELERMNSLWKS